MRPGAIIAGGQNDFSRVSVMVVISAPISAIT
jgi:hypothetical protein